MKKEIPNIITLLNFLCGVLSIVALLLWEKPVLSSCFIICGAVFDFFDGMTARALKVSGAIGKELDSLADVVSFGVAPSLIAVSLLLENKDNYTFLQFGNSILCYLPLFMAVMSCYRLAKFNVDERQTLSFIGLPTPANALIWLTIPIINYFQTNDIFLWGINSKSLHSLFFNLMNSPYFIVPLSIVLGILLVGEIPLFALKFKNLSWHDNKVKYIFLSLSLLLIILFNFYAFPFIILIYILLSILNNLFLNKK
ncbi:MAG: CDP-alcohol phosphatidyltransferase family protein [Bacteroidota bacterium]|nr:CDP-alcohol phosphatidyltransferase family protein [Bacteroidota bacterium]